MQSPATFNPPVETPIYHLGTSSDDAGSGTTTGEVVPIEGGEIIARIDGEIVLASDVLWHANLVMEENLRRIPPHEMENALQEIEAFRRMLLRQLVVGLIDTKILYADFQRNVPADRLPMLEGNLHEPFLEYEVPRLSEMLEVKDRWELEKRLAELGTSMQDMKRQFVERTIAMEWQKQLAPKPKTITHEQMLEYYHEHIDQYQFPAQVQWEELMIRFDRMNGDRTAAWKAICDLGNLVWTAAKKNPDLRGPVFGGLAQQKSHGFTAEQGGFHEWTTLGALRCDEMNSALASLRVGQLSDVVESEMGFHIVRVLKRKESGRTPFTEAQAEIRKTLEQNERAGLVEAEMAKLRAKSKIWTVFDGDIDGAEITEAMQRARRQ